MKFYFDLKSQENVSGYIEQLDCNWTIFTILSTVNCNYVGLQSNLEWKPDGEQTIPDLEEDPG